MGRFDLLRSLVRSAADRARAEIEGSPPVVAAKDMIDQLRLQRTTLPDERLTSAAAHADGIVVATVTCHDGRMLIAASSVDGNDLHFSLVPRNVSFAPRGAKEIAFRVEPDESVTQSRAIVSAIAGCIAQATWPFLIPPRTTDLSGAIVDRDGSDGVRVDLRTVPALRKSLAAGLSSMVMELLELEGMVVEPGRLALRLKLPRLA